jgi:lathosterol oxidase
MQPRDFWNDSVGVWPSPLGLSLGLGAVVVGQFFTLMYFAFIMRPQAIKNNKVKDDSDVKESNSGKSVPFAAIQKSGARPYDFMEGMMTHLAQPEGFVMLGGYLIGTWMMGLMPASYYSFAGGVNWFQVAQQLLIQDLVQYLMHLIEHEVKTQSTIGSFVIKWPFNLYTVSHKPHHRFTNPRLFDAFNGSPTDTFLMILVPLVITARLVDANVWTYMAFGSLYANWLTLIHAEYSHPWDPLFRKLGLGTSSDHHVHHKLFSFNYGHTFMYWDRIFGTYRDPTSVSVFNEGI